MKIEISPDELKASLVTWMSSQGIVVTMADEFLVDAHGNVCIIYGERTLPAPSATAVVPVQPPVVVVPTVPVILPDGPLAGHSVTGDPPYSATVRCTMFGLDYDGSDDKGDQDSKGNPLTGFFHDPKTGQPYVTHTKELVGASLPRETMLSTFLKVDAWKTQGINEVWSTHGSMLRQWVNGNKPVLNIDACGKSIFAVQLVDAGPAESTGSGLDLTYAAAKLLGTHGNAMATYEIIVGGKAIEIRDWPIRS